MNWKDRLAVTVVLNVGAVVLTLVVSEGLGVPVKSLMGFTAAVVAALTYVVWE
jgi:hypothetical protein